MKKLEYRCGRCLIIEEKWATNSKKPSITVPCHKCGGLAIRIPWSKAKDGVFEDLQEIAR